MAKVKGRTSEIFHQRRNRAAHGFEFPTLALLGERVACNRRFFQPGRDG